MDQEQNPQTQTDTATEDVGSLDAAAQAFLKREEPLAEPEGDVEASAEDAEADPDAEVSDDEPEVDEPELTEVEVEGVKLKLTAEQADLIHKSTLRQSDYSRKMNDVSAKEAQAKQAIEVAERLRAGAEKFADALANIRGIDGQIKQYEALDWQKLRAEDPANYAAYAADLQTLKINRQQAEFQARGVSAQVDEEANKALQGKRAEMFTELKKQLPSWSNETGQQITDYATSLGVSFETLAKTTDAALIVALDKARRFDALQKSKTELKAKAKDAPAVLKPGATKAKTQPKDEAMLQLRKFKTQDAAEVAFLARMR